MFFKYLTKPTLENMKYLVITAALFLTALSSAHTVLPDSTVANPAYDPALATRLGADEYGMKSYVFVILKTGKNLTTDKEFIAESFSGHMANMDRLVKEGKLIVAGPFGKNDLTYRGLFILSVSGSEEAKSILLTDPAVKNGLLDYELIEWYGSAALPEYLKYSEKIWKKQH